MSEDYVGWRQLGNRLADKEKSSDRQGYYLLLREVYLRALEDMMFLHPDTPLPELEDRRATA